MQRRLLNKNKSYIFGREKTTTDINPLKIEWAGLDPTFPKRYHLLVHD